MSKTNIYLSIYVQPVQTMQNMLIFYSKQINIAIV